MRTIHFPEWPQVLAQAALPERLQHSFEITIRWYLSFCRRGRAEVTVQSARDFMAWAVQEKHPQEWQVEEWKEAVRWFFRTAGTQAATQAQCQTAAQSEGSVWLPEDRTGWPEWKVAFLTTWRAQAVWACSGVRPTSGRSCFSCSWFPARAISSVLREEGAGLRSFAAANALSG